MTDHDKALEAWMRKEYDTNMTLRQFLDWVAKPRRGNR